MIKSRRRWRRGATQSLESAQPQTDPSDDPSISAQKREDQARIWEMVRRLDARQALAIELFYRQGWSIERIANASKCPPNTVKTSLSRARERLGRMMKRERMS